MAPFPKLSVRERILAYLASVEPSGQGLASTQVGIASATGQHRGHVSRALTSLEQEGRVVKERRRVPGFTRTLLVCGLTADGREAVRLLAEGLAGLVVEVRRPGVPPRHQPLGEALRETSLGLWDALRQLESEGSLAAGAGAGHRPETEYVWDLEEAPSVHDLIDRQEELARLARWMRQPEPCCTVEGPGGVGKSALVLQAVRTTRPPRHVLWLRLGAGPEASRARLVAFLGRLGRPMEPVSLGTALERLPERVRGLPVLLVLDDAHRADPDLRRCLERLASDGRRGTLKTVWVGRGLLLQPEALRRALRLEPGPLPQAASETLLAALEVPEPQRPALAACGGGNPLLLELLATARNPEAARASFAHHLVGDLERRASPEAWGLLLHLCALRAPVVREALGRLEFPGWALDELERECLVARAADGLEVPDEVRAFLYDRMGDAERRRVHDAWSQAFEPSQGLDDVLEFLHHLTQAGRRLEAAWWALQNQTRLLLWARDRFSAVEPAGPTIGS